MWGAVRPSEPPKKRPEFLPESKPWDIALEQFEYLIKHNHNGCSRSPCGDCVRWSKLYHLLTEPFR